MAHQGPPLLLQGPGAGLRAIPGEEAHHEARGARTVRVREVLQAGRGGERQGQGLHAPGQVQRQRVRPVRVPGGPAGGDLPLGSLCQVWAGRGQQLHLGGGGETEAQINQEVLNTRLVN